MHEPIDIDAFTAQLADDGALQDALMAEIEDPIVLFLDELHDEKYTAETLASFAAPVPSPVEARERTIDAIIRAVTSTPAVSIRETLDRTLTESLAAEVHIQDCVRIADIERWLLETDGGE